MIEVNNSETSEMIVGTSVTLTELGKYTVYNFTIQALTNIGIGPGASTAVRTDSDSKYIYGIEPWYIDGQRSRVTYPVIQGEGPGRIRFYT